ncbi:ABC transporter permease [Candidatus Woesearchaeota archaeon]|nr:MAG: ABC transporter permease [Candidatus Woesearchaeota archaeon]
MKLLGILKKNFKLLLRSKMTALVVILGPLLIILLVGFAFNNSSTSTFTIGVYENHSTELSASFIAQLHNGSFEVINYTNEQECLQSIKQGITQACLVFPENFVIEEGTTKEMKVYADYSRTNFVFYLVETVSSNLNIKKTELSVDLTNQILNALNAAKTTNQQAIEKLNQLKGDAESTRVSLDQISKNLNALNFESENVDLSALEASIKQINTSVKSLYEGGLSTMAEGIDALQVAIDTGSYPNSSVEDQIEDAHQLLSNHSSYTNKYNDTLETISNTLLSINSTTKKVAELQTKLENAKSFKTSASTSFTTILANLNTMKTALEEQKNALQTVNDNIENIRVKSAESIVSPITTNVEPVVTETTSINYMFPYLIMLIVMFISILLSSTLIIMEKKSEAYFRNFTTPTSDILFIFATYLTNIIVMIVQLTVLLSLAYFGLQVPVLNNIWLVLLMLFIGMTLFTVIGMGIGYWFSSQEAAIMLSMSVASILLLISNFILPLETMPAYIQTIASYNPYVMLSELLRQLIIFNVIPHAIYEPIGLLAGAAIVIFMLILAIQKISKMKYFKRLPHTEKQKNEKKKVAHKSFKLYEKSIESEFDLLKELKAMDDATFETYVNKDKNDFYNWAKYILKDKKLAGKLKTKSRKEMVANMEK